MTAPATLVLATHNPGKLAELRRLLAPLPLRLLDAASLGLPLPDEIGASYRDNASIKARAAAAACGGLALGDDTGLELDVDGGAPGVHTAEFVAAAGSEAAAALRLARDHGVLAGAADVRASLCCALVLADAHRVCGEAFARVRGRLRWPPDPQVPSALAGMLRLDRGAVLDDGVLAHRRAAFARLLPTLRAAVGA
ncbi:MAG: non-canonical purine NTP pyrophosphatase [Nannocystaceae bacterium]|nr:non-canonical purine NTP pyrophosphatase [Nannocystaceae bacterium]